MKRYIAKVSAKHCSPKFAATDKETSVSLDERGNWSAWADGLGCGKDYLSAEEAIEGLYRAHGYTEITITGSCSSR